MTTYTVNHWQNGKIVGSEAREAGTPRQAIELSCFADARNLNDWIYTTDADNAGSYESARGEILEALPLDAE